MVRLAIFRLSERLSQEECFRQVFVDMYPRLIRYATPLMGDAEEAEDMVSEVMEQAWKCFDELKEDTRNGYLYKATRNACLNRLKHLNVEQHYLEALREATQADVDNGYRQHEAQLQRAETIARNLPEPTCTILRLCYWEKQTYKEVAERLGISPDTVKKHISKALRILRSEMNVGGE